MQLEVINQLLREQVVDTTHVFQRNVVKEYLQIVVLSFLYGREKYQDFIFYGGSALRQCYGLPRLSEDLDFIDFTKEVDIAVLARDTQVFFKKELEADIGLKVQKAHVYLKFPILRALGLATPQESDQLFVKIEVFQGFAPCPGSMVEVVPIFKFNRSLLVKTLDLPTLFATKLGAILHRRWERTDRFGNILAVVKGRDYFDLLWYLEKGIQPNWQCLGVGMTKETVKQEVLAAVSRVDRRSIVYDLSGLIADQGYVKNIAQNLKDMVMKKIAQSWNGDLIEII